MPNVPRPMPRFHLLRNTLLTTLGMAAIVLGLLAMHSTGAEHADASTVSSAGTHAHAAVDAPLLDTAQCGEDCMQDVMGCALMVMGCAMLLTLAFILFAHRPGMFRVLLDAGGRRQLRTFPAFIPRPDLVTLSISRT